MGSVGMYWTSHRRYGAIYWADHRRYRDMLGKPKVILGYTEQAIEDL